MRRLPALLTVALLAVPASAAASRGAEDAFDWGGLCYRTQMVRGEDDRMRPTVLVIAKVAPAAHVTINFRSPRILSIDPHGTRTKVADREGFGRWRARFRIDHSHFRLLDEARMGTDSVSANVHARWRAHEVERHGVGGPCRP